MSAQKKMREAALAAGTSASSTDGLAKVTLKVEHAIDQNWAGTVRTQVLVPPGSSVYLMLLQAVADGDIKFTATWYGAFWSHLVDSINGLGYSEGGGYWSFEGQDHNGKGHEFDRGVDLISVYNRDTIMFRYVTELVATNRPLGGKAVNKA